MNVDQIAAALMALPEPQRVALASMAITGVSDTSCALQLNRLARAAGLTANELMREQFLRDCV